VRGQADRKLVKTHVIAAGENMSEVVARYCGRSAVPGDVIAVSESVVAISQGRAVPEDRIRVSVLARLLWRFVTRVPYGVGLRSPQTMQCAIDECGSMRILVAALVSALTRPFGKRGYFYRIAGIQAALIDAAHTSPVEPYTSCVILGPKNPDLVAESIKKRTGVDAAIMDINDIGGSWVIGRTRGVDVRTLEEIMRDNPMGQGDELTPICIVRGAAVLDTPTQNSL
jgi:F420-0:gamma-glutamyl ligase-like protein